MLKPLPLSALLMCGVFLISYIVIIFEHVTKINKAAAALVGGTISWALFLVGSTLPVEQRMGLLGEHFFEITQVIFFLLGAMTIVEVVDVHQGFRYLTDRICTHSKVKLLWMVGLGAFFTSAFLDNLTTTIIMVTMLRKFLPETKDRWVFGAIIVIAANAGGAWTPIGDVTTTMLWIGGHLSTVSLMKGLFFPSLISCLACLLFYSWHFRGGRLPSYEETRKSSQPLPRYAGRVTLTAFAALALVPVLKAALGLPPFLNMFIGLGILWVVTDLLHRNEGPKDDYKVCHTLKRVDVSSVLFFLGILLAISALDCAGLLSMAAEQLGQWVPSPSLLAFKLGVISSFLDNVPLVAAVMGMYDFSVFAPNDSFWEMVAYCAGTGGSITLIGSAAGVAFMGIEEVSFTWYIKKITPIAFASYLLGFLAYCAQSMLLA